VQHADPDTHPDVRVPQHAATHHYVDNIIGYAHLVA
jgi:hypothetical protein